MPKRTTPKTTRKSAKARKNAKNQPITFDESLAASWPLTSSVPTPRLSQGQLRALLIAAWAAVMVLTGSAIGLRVLAPQTAAVQVPAVPVATADVKVATTTAPAVTLSSAAKQSQPNLSVASASSVNQAQAGSPFTVLSEASFQPATTFDALTPGRTHIVQTQGTIGTDAVE